MQNDKVKTTVKEGEEPQPVEILESSIVEMAKAMKVISKSRLKRSTIVSLLHDHSRVGKGEINVILNCLDDLENLFLKAK